MATTSVKKTTTASPDAATLLRAILALLVDDRESHAADRPGQAKTEVLLADAGLGAGDIAVLLNKKPEAVRKALSRARGKQDARGSGDSDG
jgi:DNA-directed RNA polymerase specialized sigma24 family protein